MKNKFIKAVDEMNTVVLQDIGAVVKVGKKYSFNHFLKFNDGRFSKYIQNNEGLSKEDADKKVKLWIDEIKNQLTKKGEYTFDLAGTLFRESENKYSWQDKDSVKNKTVEINDERLPSGSDVKLPVYEGGYLSIHFNVKRSKDEIKRIKKIDELIEFTKDDHRSSIIEAVEKQKNKIEKSENVLPIKAPIKESVKPEKEAVIKDEIDSEVKEQVEKESKILEIIKEKEEADGVPKKENSDKKVPTKFKIDKKVASQVENEITPKKKESKITKKIIIIALLLIVVGGSIVGVLKYDMLEKIIFNGPDNIDLNDDPENSIDPVKSEVVTKEDAELNTDNIIKDEDVSEAEFVETTEETGPKISEEPIINNAENEIAIDNEANTGNYHPVVGSFKVSSNADNLVKTLIEDGFSQASILKDDYGYYYVKLGSYTTRKEASEVLISSELEGWVKKK